jgi:hypothetical protein
VHIIKYRANVHILRQFSYSRMIRMRDLSGKMQTNNCHSPTPALWLHASRS